MGKYSSYSTKQDAPQNQRQVHPIWRGIGLAMILLIPFLSYVSALVLLDENRKRGWLHIPADLIMKYSDPLILVKVLLTVAVAFILYIIFTFITFMLFSVFAPPRYGPTDAPPVRYRGKNRVR